MPSRNVHIPNNIELPTLLHHRAAVSRPTDVDSQPVKAPPKDSPSPSPLRCLLCITKCVRRELSASESNGLDAEAT